MESHKFTTASRGFHHYQKTWKPLTNETLTVKLQPSNAHDPYAVAFLDQGGAVVGHIPREISRAMFYFIKREGKILAQVITTKRNRSPIEQGGLEIPVTVTATHTNATVIALLKSFIASRNQHYREQAIEEIPTVSHSKVAVTKIKPTSSTACITLSSDEEVHPTSSGAQDSESQPKPKRALVIIESSDED